MDPSLHYHHLSGQQLLNLVSVRRPHKKKLAGKKFHTNEEVISETKAKNKSYYKSGIEMLKQHWNECVTLNGNYVDQ